MKWDFCAFNADLVQWISQFVFVQLSRWFTVCCQVKEFIFSILARTFLFCCQSVSPFDKLQMRLCLGFFRFFLFSLEYCIAVVWSMYGLNNLSASVSRMIFCLINLSPSTRGQELFRVCMTSLYMICIFSESNCRSYWWRSIFRLAGG